MNNQYFKGKLMELFKQTQNKSAVDATRNMIRVLESIYQSGQESRITTNKTTKLK